MSVCAGVPVGADTVEISRWLLSIVHKQCLPKDSDSWGHSSSDPGLRQGKGMGSKVAKALVAHFGLSRRALHGACNAEEAGQMPPNKMPCPYCGYSTMENRWTLRGWLSHRQHLCHLMKEHNDASSYEDEVRQPPGVASVIAQDTPATACMCASILNSDVQQSTQPQESLPQGVDLYETPSMESASSSSAFTDTASPSSSACMHSPSSCDYTTGYDKEAWALVTSNMP